jgi:sugar phosphate permease
MVAIATMPLATASVFVPSMVAGLETSVTAVTMFISISAVGALIFSFLLGALVKKVPTKVLIIVGGIFTGLLYVTIGLTTSLPLIYGVAFLQGIGLVIAGMAMAQTVISRWFIKARGTMISLCMVSIMLLAAILNPVLTAMIQSYGYQVVALWAGIISGAIIVLLGVVFIVDSPEKLGQKPHGYVDVSPEAATEQQAKATGSSVVNFTLKTAIATSPFWFVMLYKVLSIVAAQAIGSQALNFYQSIGLDPITASYMISVNALIGLAFAMISGILCDKKTPTHTAVMTAGIGAIAFLGAFLWSGVTGAIVAAICFAATSGCAIYGPMMMLKLFGVRDAGSLVGFINGAGNFGSFLGPIIAAAFFDMTGSYTLAFTILGVGLVIAVLLSLVAGSKKTAANLKTREAALQVQGAAQQAE